ncbi:MAG: tetratricopeptide repeat protein [Verrucomicrobiia bacterium]
MKKLVVFAVFAAAVFTQCGPLFAAAPARDASDLFLRAYLQIQEGDSAFDKGDYTAAQTRYKDALTILKDIQSVQPDWNPHIINFRERYCNQRIDEAKTRLAGDAPAKTPAATASPRTMPPSPAAGTVAGGAEQKQPPSDLSQELERLREQVRRMQAERAATPAPVVAPAPVPAPALAPIPAPEPKRAEAENAQVKKLESELADMRKQLQQFIGDKHQTPPPVPLPSTDAQRVTEMTDQIATLRSQLQQLLAERAQWEQSRQEFARLQAERSSLLSQLQEKDQRLSAGPSALEASQTKTLTEQLAQSARTIEALRSESKQLSTELTTVRNDARDKAAKVAQLMPLTDQLTATKAEIAKIREELAAKDQQIIAKQQALVTKSQEAAQAELQIKDMAALQKSNVNLRLSLDKVESLITLGKNREQESSTQIDQLKQQLQEVKTQLTEAQRKDAEVAKLRKELADKNLEVNRAQDQVKNLTPLQKTNTDLRLSMSKAEALVAAAMNRERESSAQFEQLKQQLKEAEMQLADARRKPAKPSAVSAADVAAAAQVEELKRKLEESERRAATDRAQADGAAAAQVEEWKRKLAEAEGRAKANQAAAAQVEELKRKLEEAGRRATTNRAPTDAAAVAQTEELKRKLEVAEGRAKANQAAVAQAEELKQKLAETERRAAVDRAKADHIAAAQVEGLKRKLEEAEGRAKADHAAVAQVEELKQKLAESERRAAANRTKADRTAVTQVEELKRKLEEAESRATDAAKNRVTLVKERDVLQLAIEKKTAEYQQITQNTAADRKKLASLEKKYGELKHQVSVLEMTSRKLSPEEEAFLKRTEVLVQQTGSDSVSGEINANVHRAKERALAQVAALDVPASIPPRPAPKSVQAAPAPETTRVANNSTNSAVRTSPSQTTTSPTAATRTSPPQTTTSPTAVVPTGTSQPAAPPTAAARSAAPEISADLKPLVDEARDLFSQKKFEEAAVKYREILKRDPENLFGLSNLAVIRFQQDRLEEAEHLLNRAIQIAPNDAYSHATIGIIYFKQERTDDAIEELTRALKLNPGNVEAHNYLGIACWKKGWRSAAEQELRRAIEMRPDYADAHYNLSVIYATQKPPFLGLAKFHYRKTLELGRSRDLNLEKSLAGDTLDK